MQRVKGLLILGEEYSKHRVSSGAGIDSFLTHIGMTTGMFGEVAEAYGPAAFQGGEDGSGSGIGSGSGSASTDDNGRSSPRYTAEAEAARNAHTNGYSATTTHLPSRSGEDDSMLSEKACQEKLVEVAQGLSVKELKILIAKLRGVSIDCLERRELEKRTKTLLIARLGTETLRGALKDIYIDMDALDGLDVDSCEREMLVDILLA